MNLIFRSILALLLFLTVASDLSGQGTVRYEIVDASDRSPIPFVTLQLINSSNIDTIAFKTVADFNGKIDLDNVLPGVYDLTLNALGYKEFKASVPIENNDTLFNIITLEFSAVALAGIEVIASKTTLEIELGKQTVNIGQDLLSQGGTALEALEILPAIETNLRGDIYVRGSSDVAIFINGRPTNRDGRSLATMPVSSIERIELITNPSAEYAAAGIAGIINIILRRNVKDDFKLTGNGTIKFPVDGDGYEYVGGINGNLSIGKVNIIAGITGTLANYENREINDRTYKVNADNDLSRYLHRSISDNDWNDLDIFSSINYEIDTTANFEIGYRQEIWDNGEVVDQVDLFDYLNSEDSNINTNNLYQWKKNDQSLSALFEKKWRKKERKLTIDLLFNRVVEDSDRTFNVDNIPILATPLNQSIKSDTGTEKEKSINTRLSYKTPLLSIPGNLLTGIESTVIDNITTQDLDYYRTDLQIGTNNFSITQQLHAAYALHEKEFGDLQWKIGLRYEYYRHDGKQQLTDSLVKDSYYNIFPSVQTTYSFNPKVKMSGSYSYRIDRPDLYKLNPYLSFRDPLNVRTGNPFLQPQLAHRYELSIQKNLEKGKLMFSAFGNHTDNVIQRIALPDGERVLFTYTNIGRRDRFGSTLFYNFGPFEWLQTNSSVTLYYDQYSDGREEVLTYTNNLSWNLKTNQVAELNKHFKIQLNESYRAPRRGVQELRPGVFYLDLRLRWSSENKRLALTLSATDLLGTRNIIEETISPEVNVSRELIYQFRQIGISGVYKLIQ